MRRVPVWPMAAGVAVAMVALEFVCSWLRQGSLPKIGVIFLTTSLLFMAATVSGLVARTIYATVSPGRQRVSTPVVRAACLVALWVPAWVLFIETWSLLMILAGCVCLASLGVLLKRCAVDEAVPADGNASTGAKTPFLLEFSSFSRVMLPSVLLALLAEAAVILMAARWFVTASFAAGAFAAVVGWRAVQRFAGSAAKPILPGSRQVAMATLAFVFTMIALLPYMKVPPLSFGLMEMMGHKGRVKDARASAKSPADASSDGYTGIILLPLSDEQKKIFAPQKRQLVPNFSVKIAKPLEIPFDGAYWYFKAPDKAPRPTARVVRGSSTKTLIQSTDRYPLLMEAHQKLTTPIDLGCCSAMELVVENADRREGAIALEMWVKKRADAKAGKPRVNVVAPAEAPHYLGTVAIPSSELRVSLRAPAGSKPPEERLKFPIPAAMDGVMFDEITVVVHSAPSRATTGAQVAIRKFVLEP